MSSAVRLCVGRRYVNRGDGAVYLCVGVVDGKTTLIRIRDGWKLVAYGIRTYPNGSVEWDYSRGVGYVSL